MAINLQSTREMLSALLARRDQLADTSATFLVEVYPQGHQSLYAVFPCWTKGIAMALEMFLDKI
jgi:hypothetical protein